MLPRPANVRPFKPKASPLRLNANALLAIIGGGCLISSPFWFHELFFAWDPGYGASTSADIGGVGLLLLFNAVLVLLVSNRDAWLRRTMLIALLAKVAASALYISMVVRVYQYSADMPHYFSGAFTMALQYQFSGNIVAPDPWWGTNFVGFITGLASIFLTGGPSLPISQVGCGMLGFWGSYYLYRAFCVAFPRGRRQSVAMCLFFLPSLVFWTSAIGKDAIIFFGIGLAAYGFALINARASVVGYFLLPAGTLVTLAVRPHVAAMLALSFIVPFAFSAGRAGIWDMLLKTVTLPLVIVGTVYLIASAQSYTKVEDAGGSTAAVQQIAKSNREAGGSTIHGSLPVRVALAPFLLVRPLPFEVHSATAAVASLEGTILLFFLLRRRKSLYAGLRYVRKNAFTMFMALYAAEFTIIFAAAITNFGLLNRQRVMLVPFALMFYFAVPSQVAAAPQNVQARARPVWPRWRGSLSPRPIASQRGGPVSRG